MSRTTSAPRSRILRNRLEEARQKSVTTDDYAAVISHAIDDTDHLLVIFSALLRISQIESGSRLAAFSTPVAYGIFWSGSTTCTGAVAEDEHHVLQHEHPEGRADSRRRRVADANVQPT